jgi:hypothetical protein
MSVAIKMQKKELDGYAKAVIDGAMQVFWGTVRGRYAKSEEIELAKHFLNSIRIEVEKSLDSDI